MAPRAGFSASPIAPKAALMCSDYRSRVELVGVEKALAQAGLALDYPEGRPNMEPREDIRITDRAPILRASASTPGAAELVQRRWSWPGPGGRPVYNFRSDNRQFGSGRCLIVADGFYEFTTPSDPKARRKHKWLFTLSGAEWFGIAGLWRATPDVGEAFTMLTTEPGADVAPYHSRQIVTLPPAEFARWLDPAIPAAALLRPLPPGSLEVSQVC
jgi:putative SOS response-associated peptidase YedK